MSAILGSPLVMLLIILLIVLVPFWRIVKRTGHSGWWSRYLGVLLRLLLSRHLCTIGLESGEVTTKRGFSAPFTIIRSIAFLSSIALRGSPGKAYRRSISIQ
jgi:hypothetical protein